MKKGIDLDDLPSSGSSRAYVKLAELGGDRTNSGGKFYMSSPCLVIGQEMACFPLQRCNIHIFVLEI